jgi:hypothetical protein
LREFFEEVIQKTSMQWSKIWMNIAKPWKEIFERKFKNEWNNSNLERSLK